MLKCKYTPRNQPVRNRTLYDEFSSLLMPLQVGGDAMVMVMDGSINPSTMSVYLTRHQSEHKRLYRRKFDRATNEMTIWLIDEGERWEIESRQEEVKKQEQAEIDKARGIRVKEVFG